MKNKNEISQLLIFTALIAAPSAVNAVPISSLPATDLVTTYAEFGNNLTESLTTISGNVGVSSGGTLNLMGPSVINGSVYVASGATFSKQGTVNGAVYTGQNLTAPQAQVYTASSSFAGLASDQSITALNSAMNFSAAAGTMTVVDIGSISLNNANITFSGSGDLVLNITNGLSLVGNASIRAAAGSSSSHIFINNLNTGSINTHVGDIIDGYVFDPYGTANFDGVVNGGIYGGDANITLLSGFALNGVQPPPPSPAPDASSSGLLLALGCGLLALVKRAFKS